MGDFVVRQRFSHHCKSPWKPVRGGGRRWTRRLSAFCPSVFVSGAASTLRHFHVAPFHIFTSLSVTCPRKGSNLAGSSPSPPEQAAQEENTGERPDIAPIACQPSPRQCHKHTSTLDSPPQTWRNLQGVIISLIPFYFPDRETRLRMMWEATNQGTKGKNFPLYLFLQLESQKSVFLGSLGERAKNRGPRLLGLPHCYNQR